LEGENATARALRLRRLSRESTLDIQSNQDYFGKAAKEQFYAQYKQLYSRPYLFMDSSVADAGVVDDILSQDERLDECGGAESTIVPVYPSSFEMRKVNEELNPSRLVSRVSSSTISSEHRPELPLRDKLSPRAHFLASCVAKPQVVVPFLIRNRNTKVFDFSFQSLGDAAISAFAKSLVHDLPLVEEISVRDNRLTDDGLNDLLHAVSVGSLTLHLRRLDISQNQIGPKSAQTLRSYLVSPSCTVEMLHVDNADIDDHECAAFMTAFEKNQSIKRLWMSRNCIGKAENLNVVQPGFTTGGEAIAKMLHVNPVLVHLDLSWNYLRLESSIALATSIRENGTLVELKLAYNACADAGAMMFGEALRFNKTLQRLDLSYNSVGVKGAMVLAGRCSSTATTSDEKAASCSWQRSARTERRSDARLSSTRATSGRTSSQSVHRLLLQNLERRHLRHRVLRHTRLAAASSMSRTCPCLTPSPVACSTRGSLQAGTRSTWARPTTR